MKSIFQKPVHERIYYVYNYSDGSACVNYDDKFKEHINIYETDKEFELNEGEKICIEREPLTIKEIIKSVDDNSIIYITREIEKIEDLEYKTKIETEVENINKENKEYKEKDREKEKIKEFDKFKLEMQNKYSFKKYKYGFIASVVLSLYLLIKVM